MIDSLRKMATCWWSGRRIQRYIDADPAAELTAEEIQRLEAHLVRCERCTAVVNESRGLKSTLARLADRRSPDPARVARLCLQARRMSHGELG